MPQLNSSMKRTIRDSLHSDIKKLLFKKERKMYEVSRIEKEIEMKQRELDRLGGVVETFEEEI